MQMSFADLEKRKRRRSIKTYGSLVRRLLKDNPGCRNNDKLLMLMAYQEVLKVRGDSVTITIDNIAKIPSAETIIRTRAKIQNVEHQFLPTDPQVRKQRGISEEVWREWAQASF